MEIFIQNSFMTMPLRVPSACCHDIGISSALVAKLKKKNVNLINSGVFFSHYIRRFDNVLKLLQGFQTLRFIVYDDGILD